MNHALVKVCDSFAVPVPILALGGDLKARPGLLEQASLQLSPPLGDLAEPGARSRFDEAIASLQADASHPEAQIVIDLHPGYHSHLVGHQLAPSRRPPLLIQHHHAHLASCMAEHGLSVDSSAIFGVALDGLGYGLGGQLWGGEVGRVDFTTFERSARLRPVPLLGGDLAARQPWRNAYAYLVLQLGWPRLLAEHGTTDIVGYLRSQPHELLDAALLRGINSPSASSCGRLFDAVAACVGLHRDAIAFEAQAAIALQQAAELYRDDPHARSAPYPFNLIPDTGDSLSELVCDGMWPRLLADVERGMPAGSVALRFHLGLALGLCEAVFSAAAHSAHLPRIVALSGGVFQNALLRDEMRQSLEARGFQVLLPQRMPAHDEGLCLGQAVLAAARIKRFDCH